METFIKRLDYLSPHITFYHKSFLSHSSIISGILSIISIILIIISVIYFSLEIIEKKEPKIFSFNSFINDSGYFPMNSSSLFHFISIAHIFTNFEYDGVDFGYFRIIGFEELFDNYLIDKNLNSREHWLYGKCNNETDTEGIAHLVNYDYFERSACIREYFNPKDQKYYDTGDPKFRWPEMAHGTYNKNYKIYNLIIEKCQEDTINYILGENSHCKNFSELEEIYANFSLYGAVSFYFINHYIDVLDYENPDVKFFYNVEGILNKEQYSVNNLNFNPSLVKTHNGLIFDNVIEEKGFIFERNDVAIKQSEGNGVFIAFILWPKNTIHYHERIYKRILDIISSIGGISQFVTIIAIYINSLYHNFIILIDTQYLLHSSIETEKIINIENKKLNKIKDLEKEKFKKELQNSSDKRKFNTEKSNNKINKNKTNISQSNNNCITSFEKSNSNNSPQLNKINEKNIQLEKKINMKTEKNNFFNYLVYKLSCRKKNNSFEIYNHFRIKMISEEHLIRNHLNIYNLLRVTSKKRNHKRNSYQLKDLIKLI